MHPYWHQLFDCASGTGRGRRRAQVFPDRGGRGPGLVLWPGGRVAAQPLRSGLAPDGKLPAPVVSVGNLTVGGTGKTPVVACLARLLTRPGEAGGHPQPGLRRGESRRHLHLRRPAPIPKTPGRWGKSLTGWPGPSPGWRSTPGPAVMPPGWPPGRSLNRTSFSWTTASSIFSFTGTWTWCCWTGRALRQRLSPAPGTLARTPHGPGRGPVPHPDPVRALSPPGPAYGHPYRLPEPHGLDHNHHAGRGHHVSRGPGRGSRILAPPGLVGLRRPGPPGSLCRHLSRSWGWR